MLQRELTEDMRLDAQILEQAREEREYMTRPEPRPMSTYITPGKLPWERNNIVGPYSKRHLTPRRFSMDSRKSEDTKQEVDTNLLRANSSKHLQLKDSLPEEPGRVPTRPYAEFVPQLAVSSPTWSTSIKPILAPPLGTKPWKRNSNLTQPGIKDFRNTIMKLRKPRSLTTKEKEKSRI